MALSKSTFKTNEVALFLSRRYPFATTCFSQDMLKHGDTVKSVVVEKWFKSYFPSEVAYSEYRMLEANVTQTLKF
jgi:hypothetical protein